MWRVGLLAVGMVVVGVASSCGGRAALEAYEDVGAGAAGPTSNSTNNSTNNSTSISTNNSTSNSTNNSSSVTTGTSTVVTTVVTSSSSGQPCDQGSCDECANCSIEGGPCTQQYDICINSMNCIEFADCIQQCGPGDPNCQDFCGQQFPQGAVQYTDLIDCAICNVCAMSCAGEFPGFCGN